MGGEDDLGLDVGGDVGGDAPADDMGLDMGGDEGLDGLADELGGEGEAESVTCSRADLMDVLQQVSDGMMSVDDAVAQLAAGAAGDPDGGDLPSLDGDDLGGEVGAEDDGLDMGGDEGGEDSSKPSFMESKINSIANLITEDPDVFSVRRRNRK